MSDSTTTPTPDPVPNSIFYCGWRPALGWIVVGGFALQFVCIPFANIVFAFMEKHVAIPSLDMAPLLSLTTGVLGLSGLRTFEKLKGIATV